MPMRCRRTHASACLEQPPPPPPPALTPAAYLPFTPSPSQVPEEDLQRVAEATGAAVQTTVNSLDAERALGTCAHFEERQIGAERYNIFKGVQEWVVRP